MRHTFHVDLRGIVDLLSHNLYTSPRVFMREVLQNSVDAITQRQSIDSAARGRILIEAPNVTGDGTLRIHDTGVGLTEPQVHEFLATIGRSSKRDDLGFARHDFLGQFGIGLLSCFMVADDIEVVTRSAEPDSDTVVWRGNAGGHYVVETTSPRSEPGTTVTLSPRAGASHWFAPATVRELAEHYGGLLPFDVWVGHERVNAADTPWARDSTEPARRERLLRYGQRILGTAPFDVIDLNVPEAGLSGVAFVLPTPTHPTERPSHRVYLKRMLIGDRVERLLPEWAFFARGVVNTEELRPTASREQLYDDELLESAREALGTQLKDWMTGLATTSPTRLSEFLRVHGRGVQSLALHDDDMLRLVDQWLEQETSDGWMTMTEFRRRHGRIVHTTTVDEFRRFSAVAAAQGVGLVNGGYSLVSELLERLPRLDPSLRVEQLDPTVLATRFDPVDPASDAAVSRFCAAAGPALEALGCVPDVRAFDPPSLPSLYLKSDAWRAHTDRTVAAREAKGAWADLLGSMDAAPAEARPVLVFNYRNPTVRRLVTIDDAELAEAGAEALYSQALLAGRHPMTPADTASTNRSFLSLLDYALHR
ncbi:HSP90 family protein [Spiractinospora alimapuensis]|uniref:HSP90 family protein n=1 Tax=Spiractinospora alimapuensis TaxID=2820884 RepID=UPI001EEB3560|nr:HSP90 family protein [Spiractinospora alimapuensis]QVQ50843.1 HSP90 family protein [Spiractinospora alimapuensis]